MVSLQNHSSQPNFKALVDHLKGSNPAYLKENSYYDENFNFLSNSKNDSQERRASEGSKIDSQSIISSGAKFLSNSGKVGSSKNK